MKKTIFLASFLLAWACSVWATDITVPTVTLPNFQVSGLPLGTTGTATATNASATITSSAAFPVRLVGLGGYRISLGGVDYEVLSTESTSLLTLKTAYASTTGSKSFTIYPVVTLQIYADQVYQPRGKTYSVQSGTPDSQGFYQRVGCSVKTISGVPSLILPELTLDAISDVENNAQKGARLSAYFYRLEGTRIRVYDGFGSFTLAASPTTQEWRDILRYNSQTARPFIDNSTLTREQIYEALQARGIVEGTAGRLGLIGLNGASIGDSALVQDGSGNVTAEGDVSVQGAQSVTGSSTVGGTTDVRGGYLTSTYAGLASLTGSSGYGRMVYVTDKYRLYMYMGAQWAPFGDYDLKLAGCKCDGSTNDSTIANAVIQAAIDEYGGAGSKRGAIVKFPVGICRMNLVVTEARGLTLRGQGRFSTILQSYTSGGQPLVFNGLWYSRVEGLFIDPNGVTTLPLIDLDGNWDGTHTLRVQGNTFSDIYLNGNYQAAVGLELCRQGGSVGQCSENRFNAIHLTGFTEVAFRQTGFNALQNKISDASNFQANKKSIVINSGNIHIQNVGFQEYAQPGGLRGHIDSGPMIETKNSADDLSTIRDCRFEGFPMVKITNGHRLIYEGNQVIPTTNIWASNTAYTQGTIIRGTDGGSGGKGRLYIAMNSGTSGGSDPGWADPDEAYSWTGGAINASSTSFSCSACGNLYNTKTGYGIVIAGAGAAGGYYYSTLSAWVDNSTWTLAAAASTTVASAAYHISPLLTDGSINWMPYEFDEMVVGGGGSAVLRNNVFGNGRIQTGSNANLANYYELRIEGNTFARKDWLMGGTVNYAQARFTNDQNIVNLNGGPNTGGAAVAFPATYRNGGPAPVEELSAMWIGQKTFGWAGGGSGVNYAAIYFKPDLVNNWLKFKGGKLVFDDLTSDRMVYLNANKELAVSGITTTVMQYLDPTSSVQAQLDSKASLVSPSFTTPSLGVATATNIIYSGTPQTITGAGTINLTTHATLLVTTGADAYTLAAGSEGQFKFIRMKTDGGDATITVTNGQDFTTIVMDTAGQSVYLHYLDGKWNVLSNNGATFY